MASTVTWWRVGAGRLLSDVTHRWCQRQVSTEPISIIVPWLVMSEHTCDISREMADVSVDWLS